VDVVEGLEAAAGGTVGCFGERGAGGAAAVGC